MENTNQLSLIVQNSNLEPVEAQSIIERFNTYEEIAKDWEAKAKAIVVTNASQVTEMKMAREGRLFLAQKRIDVEKTRKALKEQSLRKGQAIDAIAKFLTSLIEPTEKYLKEQEDFVKIQKEKEEERLRIEKEAQAENVRLAQEKADREERDRIKAENEKLKKEAEEREAVLSKEKEAKAKVEAELQAKKDAEDKAKRDAEDAKRLADLQPEKDKFRSYINALLDVEEPNIQDANLKSGLYEIRRSLLSYIDRLN